MDYRKSTSLKLKTRTLLTFENKAVKKGNMLQDTDPTTTTFPMTMGILTGELFVNGQRRK